MGKNITVKEGKNFSSNEIRIQQKSKITQKANFSDFTKYAKASLDLTSNIINETGLRLVGSESSKKGAHILANEMSKFCDTVKIDKFEVRPKSFLGFTKVLVITYIISLISLFIGGYFVIFGVLGLLFGTFIALSQSIFYWKIFDPFYPKKEGFNVSGIIEPEDEVKQQIIISGHHDSAYIFNFLAQPKEIKKLYGIRITLAMLIYVFLNISSIAWIIHKILTGADPGFSTPLKIITILGLVVIVPFYYFIDKDASPGAGDNLVASVMALFVSKYFSEEKAHGVSLLKNTRLIILSTDGEEAGLRGANAYVKKNKEQLQSIPTYNFNIDSIYSLKDLQFLLSDINGTIKLSRDMAEELQSISYNLGYKSKLFPMTFGGGATDAAEFAKIGVEATTLVAMPTEFIRDNIVYHTKDDVCENIEKKVVEACFKIIIKYILKKEKEISL